MDSGSRMSEDSNKSKLKTKSETDFNDAEAESSGSTSSKESSTNVRGMLDQAFGKINNNQVDFKAIENILIIVAYKLRVLDRKIDVIIDPLEIKKRSLSQIIEVSEVSIHAKVKEAPKAADYKKSKKQETIASYKKEQSIPSSKTISQVAPNNSEIQISENPKPNDSDDKDKTKLRKQDSDAINVKIKTKAEFEKKKDAEPKTELTKKTEFPKKTESAKKTETTKKKESTKKTESTKRTQFTENTPTEHLRTSTEETDILREKVLVVDKYTKGKPYAKGSKQKKTPNLKVVTFAEYASLYKTVIKIQQRYDAIQFEEDSDFMSNPIIERLLEELQCQKSLSDAMAALQLSARMDTVENTVDNLTDLLEDLQTKVPGMEDKLREITGDDKEFYRKRTRGRQHQRFESHVIYSEDDEDRNTKRKRRDFKDEREIFDRGEDYDRKKSKYGPSKGEKKRDKKKIYNDSEGQKKRYRHEIENYDIQNVEDIEEYGDIKALEKRIADKSIAREYRDTKGFEEDVKRREIDDYDNQDVNFKEDYDINSKTRERKKLDKSNARERKGSEEFEENRFYNERKQRQNVDRREKDDYNQDDRDKDDYKENRYTREKRTNDKSKEREQKVSDEYKNYSFDQIGEQKIKRHNIKEQVDYAEDFKISKKAADNQKLKKKKGKGGFKDARPDNKMKGKKKSRESKGDESKELEESEEDRDFQENYEQDQERKGVDVEKTAIEENIDIDSNPSTKQGKKHDVEEKKQQEITELIENKIKNEPDDLNLGKTTVILEKATQVVNDTGKKGEEVIKIDTDVLKTRERFPDTGKNADRTPKILVKTTVRDTSIMALGNIVSYGETSMALRFLDKHISEDTLKVTIELSRLAGTAIMMIKYMAPVINQCIELVPAVNNLESNIVKFIENLVTFQKFFDSELYAIQEEVSIMGQEVDSGLDVFNEALGHDYTDPRGIADMHSKFDLLETEIQYVDNTLMEIQYMHKDLVRRLHVNAGIIDALFLMKTDRETLEDGLAHKVGVDVINKFIGIQQISCIVKVLEEKIKKAYRKFNCQEVLWQGNIDDFLKLLNQKTDIALVEELFRDIYKNIDMIKHKINVMEIVWGDQKSQVTNKKLIRNENCLSCGTPANIGPGNTRRTMEKPIPDSHQSAVNEEKDGPKTKKERICYPGLPTIHICKPRTVAQNPSFIGEALCQTVVVNINNLYEYDHDYDDFDDQFKPDT